MPKSDYEIIDTWYAMGMAATGSKDVAVKELFVPERRALALQRCRGGLEHPGAALKYRPALSHSDRGGLQPSAGAGGDRRGRGRL